jgi:two-component system sensor histidine kinase/response regulator
VGLVSAFERAAPGDEEIGLWRARLWTSSLFSGGTWGLFMLTVFPELEPSRMLLLTTISFGLTAAGISTLGTIWSVYLAYLLSCFSGLIIAMLLWYPGDGLLLGGLLVLYAAVMSKTGYTQSEVLARATRLSLEKQALIADLTAARDAAEADRLAAQRANAAKSDFLARMSHELRTPMNGVLGTTELMLLGDLPERERRLAETSLASGRALLGLLNDILDFSKIEAGHMDLERVEFDLSAVLDDVLALFAVQAHGKGLSLAALTAPGLERRVIGDPTRLRQVLINLVGNAIKFTPEGRVTLRVGRHGQGLRFSVSDTGIGIPEEALQRLFQAFEQVDTSISRRFGGTGLGLSISSRLARLMGGELRAESLEGRGSTFSFVAELPPAAEQPAPHEALRGRRVALNVRAPEHRACLATWLTDAGLALVEDPGDAEVVLLDAGQPPAGQRLAGEVILLEDPGSDARGGNRLSRPPRRGPLEQALLRALAPEALQLATAPPRAFVGASVLVVDDHPVNRLISSTMLEHLGCEVAVVEDGCQALELLSTRRFDAVLLDCEMPVMDGLTCVRELRSREAGGDRHLVIALTAHALESYRQRCLEAGMDDVLTKPLTVGILSDCLERWLQQSDTARVA